MATLEPGIALQTLEQALRQLMTREYRLRWAEDWLDRISTADQRERWAERHQDEASKRKAVAAVAAVGLEYTELWELIKIAGKHWEPLNNALGEKKATMPLLELAERLRNTIGHNRSLTPFERDLISGIAGKVRNQVTLFMTSSDPAGDPYPRIEAVSDSFNNAVPIEKPISEVAGGVSTGLLLHPGQVVTFTCVGIDAKSRDLSWTLFALSGEQLSDEVVGPSGVPVEVSWTVRPQDVAESVWIRISMKTVGSQYHRAGHYDQSVTFHYKVRALEDS